jgi:hypothetical protein
MLHADADVRMQETQYDDGETEDSHQEYGAPS